MKETLLLVIIATLSTFVLVSCGKEGGMLVNPNGIKPTDPDGNSGEPNNGAKKCYVNEMSYSSEDYNYTTKFTYNSKNLLESKDDDGDKWNYTYDANNRLTKIEVFSDGEETFNYEYDSKGNITKVKYNSEGSAFSLLIDEFIFTTNAKGQVEKIQTVSEDDESDNIFFLEYDSKSNIKKVLIDLDGVKQTILENVSFDDKSTVYQNTNLSKASLPMILISLAFGENYTSLFNVNNVLSEKLMTISFTGEIETTTSIYTYGYSAEGYPSKMNVTRNTGAESYKEEEKYSYTCK